MAFTTVQACKEECAKTEGCVAFTTAAGTENVCYLKNRDHAAESANPTAVSVRMSCYEGMKYSLLRFKLSLLYTGYRLLIN